MTDLNPDDDLNPNDEGSVEDFEWIESCGVDFTVGDDGKIY